MFPVGGKNRHNLGTTITPKGTKQAKSEEQTNSVYPFLRVPVI